MHFHIIFNEHRFSINTVSFSFGDSTHFPSTQEKHANWEQEWHDRDKLKSALISFKCTPITHVYNYCQLITCDTTFSQDHETMCPASEGEEPCLQNLPEELGGDGRSHETWNIFPWLPVFYLNFPWQSSVYDFSLFPNHVRICSKSNCSIQ